MIDNPYWDAVKDRVDMTGSLWRTPSVDGLGMYRDAHGGFDVERWSREALHRREFVKRYELLGHPWTPSSEAVSRAVFTPSDALRNEYLERYAEEDE